MKPRTICKAFAAFTLAGIMTFNMTVTEAESAPVISRTGGGITIEYALGGFPASVRKMVYADCVFYLRDGVTDEDFEAVIALGPKPLVMHTFNNGPLYSRPAYVLWNDDKTVLLVHPMFFSSDVAAMETVSVPTPLPAGLSGAVPANNASVTPPLSYVDKEDSDYMLSAEYTEAVRAEFCRILNEYRASNGLRELEVNLELQAYADVRAAEQRDLFGHVRPNGSQAGSGWHDSKNVITSRYAENVVAFGAINADVHDTASGIFSLWKNSPAHNAHMLWDFEPNITMAFGFHPEPDDYGMISSGAVFATGY